MALMVRSIGLPARVAVGFVPPAPRSGARPAAYGGAARPGHLGLGGGPLRRLRLGRLRPVTVPTSRIRRQPDLPDERRAVTVEVPPALPQAQPDSVDAENAKQRPEVTTGQHRRRGRLAVLDLLLTILGWLALLLACWRCRCWRSWRSRPPVGADGGGPRHPQRRSPVAGRSCWIRRSTRAIAPYPGTPGPRRRRPAERGRAAGGLAGAGRRCGGILARTGQPGPGRAAIGGRSTTGARNCSGGLPLWRRWRARLSLASMRRADRRSR